MIGLNIENYGLESGDFKSEGSWQVVTQLDPSLPQINKDNFYYGQPKLSDANDAIKRTELFLQKFGHPDESEESTKLVLTPRWIKDPHTDKCYLNESKLTVRLKCGAIALGSILYAPLITTALVVARFVLTATGFRFWAPTDDSLEDRLIKWKRDAILLALTPVIGAMMIGAAASGAIGFTDPYDARKHFTSLEQILLSNLTPDFLSRIIPAGTITVAPCFRPYAKAHLLGGDISEQGAW